MVAFIGRLHKAPVVMEMDYMHIGLLAGRTWNGYMTQGLGIRTKTFRGGIYWMDDVPYNHAKTIGGETFPQFRSGMIIIPPYKKHSPGYKIFMEEPLVRMKILDLELAHVKIKLATLIEREDTPASLKEDLVTVMDLLERLNRLRGMQLQPEGAIPRALLTGEGK